MSLFLKEFEDSVGGVTGSERICEGILCQVHPNLPGIVVESIYDELKTRRRHGRFRRYFVRDRNRARSMFSVMHSAALLRARLRRAGGDQSDLPNLEVSNCQPCNSESLSAHNAACKCSRAQASPHVYFNLVLHWYWCVPDICAT